MKNKNRLPTSGEPDGWKSPFEALKHVARPPHPDNPPPLIEADTASAKPKHNRGRVDIIRQTAHRGGKTVTVVTGFVGIGQAEKERLAKEMQRACGAGGTVKEGRIEIQGDQREAVAQILTQAGFRPVYAGG